MSSYYFLLFFIGFSLFLPSEKLIAQSKKGKSSYPRYIKEGKEFLKKDSFAMAFERFIGARSTWDRPKIGTEIDYYINLTKKKWTETLTKQRNSANALRKIAETEKIIKEKSLIELSSYVLADSSNTALSAGDTDRALAHIQKAFLDIKEFNKVTLSEYNKNQKKENQLPPVTIPNVVITAFGNAFFEKNHLKKVTQQNDIMDFGHGSAKNLFYSIGKDFTVKIWRTDGTIVDSLNYQPNYILAAAISDKEDYFTACTKDTLFYVKPIGGEKTPVMGHKMAVVQAEFFDEDRKIISISRDGTAKIWDINGTSLKSHDFSVPLLSISFNNEKSKVYLRSAYKIFVLDLKDKDALPVELVSGDRYIANYEISPNEEQLIFCEYYTGKTHIQNQLGASISPNPTMEAYAIAVNPNNNRPEFLAGSKEGKLVRVNYLDPSLQTSFTQQTATRKILYAPDGKTSIAIGETTGFFMIQDNAVEKELEQNKKINHLVFSSDSRYILSSADQNEAKLWSIDGELLMVMPMGKEVKSTFFNKNNNKIIGITKEGTLFTTPIPNIENYFVTN